MHLVCHHNNFIGRLPNFPPVLVLNCDREFHDDEVVGKEMVEKVCMQLECVGMYCNTPNMFVQVKEFVSDTTRTI